MRSMKRARAPCVRVMHAAIVVFASGPIGVSCTTQKLPGPETHLAAKASQNLKPQVAYSKLPLSFEANRGQTDAQVRFLSRGREYGLFLTTTEAVLVLRHAREKSSAVSLQPAERSERIKPSGATVLRMKLIGANPKATITGRDVLSAKSHYFIGNDPSRWRSNVPTYANVQYEQVYPGVDLVFYGNQQQLEYDFVVAPGHDPGAIRLSFEGVDPLEVDPHGDLVLHSAGGELRLCRPAIYQERNGVREQIRGTYLRTGTRQVGFQVAAYDAGRPLVIDPVLSYSTYLGGSSSDSGEGLAIDSSGNVYVSGTTYSNDFPPAGTPFQATNAGGGDVFVTKLDASGTALVYSTYLGGALLDESLAIAVDASGSAYVTGITQSTNFPTVNAIQPGLGGSQDGFVAKLDATGASLVYSTYLGGSRLEVANAIAVDPSGNAYVTGYTTSVDFPVVNAVQPAFAGGILAGDAFVSKLNASGTALVYSTYLGGSSDEEAFGIAVDGDGNAYVAGQTNSNNFPTKGPYQPILAGGDDAFIAKLDPGGSNLVYSTYLGGLSSDKALAIAVDRNGNAYVTGNTVSSIFPLVPMITGTPFQAANAGGVDAFVAKLDASGAALVYSTFLGGSGNESGTGIAVDPAGDVYVTGWTNSSNFPTVDPLQGSFAGGTSDAFVAKLNPAGSQLVYSTYLGGDQQDIAQDVATDGAGSVYVTGHTFSTNFPTTNALQSTFGGLADAFVAKISE